MLFSDHYVFSLRIPFIKITIYIISSKLPSDRLSLFGRSVNCWRAGTLQLFTDRPNNHTHLVRFFMVLAHWNNSPRVDMSPLCEEVTNTNLIVFGLTRSWFEPIINHTRGGTLNIVIIFKCYNFSVHIIWFTDKTRIFWAIKVNMHKS
jgi:hypothetical protein